MKIASFTLTCLVLLGLECALLRLLGTSVARADVHVAFILFLATRSANLEAAVGCFAIGYLVDAVSGQPSWLYVFTSMFTFLSARLLAPFVELRSGPSFAVAAAGVDLIHGLAAWGLVVLATPQDVSRMAMGAAIPATAGLTALVALAVWPVLRQVESLFKKPESGLLM